MSPLDSYGFGFLHRDGGHRGPLGSHVQLSEQEACKVPDAERAPETEARQVPVRAAWASSPRGGDSARRRCLPRQLDSTSEAGGVGGVINLLCLSDRLKG